MRASGMGFGRRKTICEKHIIMQILPGSSDDARLINVVSSRSRVGDLADFDELFAVVAAVGMWATLLQRCPYVHSDIGPVILARSVKLRMLAVRGATATANRLARSRDQSGGSMQVRILSRR
jgi:hypothetical protein